MKKTLEGLVATLLLVGACGGAVGKPTVGGESHFLRHCEDGCGELTCVADLCTRTCLIEQGRCGDLAEGATCTNRSVEPGSVAICDRSCRVDADCAAVGSDFGCQGGFCRPKFEPQSGGGTGATAGSAGASGAGGNSDVCSLPFDAGSCRGAIPVFAAVDGKCQPKLYGGCDGNANRFNTVEECMATCEARPGIEACPAGREPQTICLGCGPAGGCAKEMRVCAQPCSAQADCDSKSLQCAGGYCEASGCL
jgi:hypothetical protein